MGPNNPISTNYSTSSPPLLQLIANNWPTVLFVGLLFIVSFNLRWWYINNTRMEVPIRGDAVQYTVIAKNIALFGAYSTDTTPPFTSKPNHRDPGYPLFLAPIVKNTTSLNHFFFTAVLIQSILGALTVVATYFLAKLFLPPLWSSTVAILTLLSPHLINMSINILTEPLFTFLLTVALLFYGLFIKRKNIWFLIGSGLFIGLAILVRSVLQLFPVALAGLTFYVFRNDRKKALKYCMILLTTSFIFFTPWKIWSYVTFKDAPPISSSLLKATFYSGIFDGFIYDKIPSGAPRYGIGMITRDDPNFSNVIEGGYGKIFSEIAKRFQENPISYTSWWLIGKPAMFWRWKQFFGDGITTYPVIYTWYDHNKFLNLTKIIMEFMHPIMLTFMHIGAVLTILKNKKQPEPQNIITYTILLLLFYFVSIHTILAPDPRYSLPLRPLMYLLAISGISECVKFCFDHGRSILHRKASLIESPHATD